MFVCVSQAVGECKWVLKEGARPETRRGSWLWKKEQSKGWNYWKDVELLTSCHLTFKMSFIKLNDKWVRNVWSLLLLLHQVWLKVFPKGQKSQFLLQCFFDPINVFMSLRGVRASIVNWTQGSLCAREDTPIIFVKVWSQIRQQVMASVDMSSSLWF